MKREVVIVCVFPTLQKLRSLFPFGVFVFEKKHAEAKSKIFPNSSRYQKTESSSLMSYIFQRRKTTVQRNY